MTLAATPVPGPFLVVTGTETLTDVANAGVNTTVLQTGMCREWTFYIFNNSNQSVTFQAKASATAAFTTDQNAGDAIVIAASGEDIATLTDPHPFLRWNVDPAADSTGNITIVAIGRP